MNENGLHRFSLRRRLCCEIQPVLGVLIDATIGTIVTKW